MTADGWQVEVIYPWWPRATVVLDYLYITNYTYLKMRQLLIYSDWMA